MTRPDITLVRHGQTEWSESLRHTGRTDIPLTGLGRRQAAALGGMLLGQFSSILSSPLTRAWETMVAAGFEGRGVANGDLVEWDYGEHEGITTNEIRREIPDWSVWTHPIEQGESLDDVGQRADRVIDLVLESDGPVLIFAHAHILRIIGARWVSLRPVDGRSLTLDTATVSTLGWERENRVIRTWNIVCHVDAGKRGS